MVYSAVHKNEFPWSKKDERCTKSAYCIWCEKSFRIDSMGRSAFVSHADGKKHKQLGQSKNNNQTISSFFKSDTVDSTGTTTNSWKYTKFE